MVAWASCWICVVISTLSPDSWSEFTSPPKVAVDKVAAELAAEDAIASGSKEQPYRLMRIRLITYRAIGIKRM